MATRQNIQLDKGRKSGSVYEQKEAPKVTKDEATGLYDYTAGSPGRSVGTWSFGEGGETGMDVLGLGEGETSYGASFMRPAEPVLTEREKRYPKTALWAMGASTGKSKTDASGLVTAARKSVANVGGKSTSGGRTTTVRNVPVQQERGGFTMRPASMQPTTRSTVTRRTFQGNMPQVPDVPAFVMPKYDEGKVRKKTQRYAAAGTRKLRRGLQQALMRGYENPNVRRMMLREAMQGYGLGLENVMAGAHREAESEYSRERSEEIATARTNYQARMAMIQQAYNAAMQKYMNSAVTTQTTTTGAGTSTGNVNTPGSGKFQTRMTPWGQVRV